MGSSGRVWDNPMRKRSGPGKGLTHSIQPPRQSALGSPLRFWMLSNRIAEAEQTTSGRTTVIWKGKPFTADADSHRLDFLVASAYQEIGEAQEARRWFCKMAKKSAHSVPAYYHLSAAEARIGHFAAARAAYRRILEVDPEEKQARRMLADVERFMGEVIGEPVSESRKFGKSGEPEPLSLPSPNSGGIR